MTNKSNKYFTTKCLYKWLGLGKWYEIDESSKFLKTRVVEFINPKYKSIDFKGTRSPDMIFLSTVLAVVNSETLVKKTGYNQKKISNLLYKLRKRGKIKSPEKGIYVKV